MTGMTIENKTIDQKQLNQILKDAYEKGGYKITFIGCYFMAAVAITGCTLTKLSFEKCTFNRLAIEGCMIDVVACNNCIFYSLTILRSNIGELKLCGTCITFMFAATSYISEMCFRRIVEIDHCALSDVGIIEKFTKGIGDEDTERARREDIPPVLANEIIRTSKPICPEDGSFIGYKKAYVNDAAAIVKLLIPADAKRVSPVYSRKCRCDKAEVLEIKTLDGKDIPFAYSKYDRTFAYTVGKTATPNGFDDDPFIECSRGIHFFTIKQEAVEYKL